MASRPDFFKAHHEPPELSTDFRTYFDAEFKKTFPEAEELLEIFKQVPASWMKPVLWALARLYKDIQMERLAPLFAEDSKAPLNLGPSLQTALTSALGYTEIRYQRLLTSWITTHNPLTSTPDGELPSESAAKEAPHPLERLQSLNRPMANLIACLLLRGRIPQLGNKNLENAATFLEKAALDPKLTQICDYLRNNPECEASPLLYSYTDSERWSFSDVFPDKSALTASELAHP